MAAAFQPRNSYQAYLTDMERSCTTAIFADSYLSNARLHSDMIMDNPDGRRKLSLGPHMIANSSNPDQFQHLSYIDNYSFGVAKMTTTCRNERIVHQWANHMPRLTICHLGACDLANGAVGKSDTPRSSIQTHTHQFFNELKDAGRRLAGQARFDSALTSHQFLLIGIPQWGEYKNVREESLEWLDLKKARRPANEGLKRAMSGFWNEHRALLYTPELSWPEFTRNRDGTQTVHLSHATQQVYTDQILAMARKMLCSYCTLDPLYDRRTHENFKMSVGVCKRMQHNA